MSDKETVPVAPRAAEKGKKPLRPWKAVLVAFVVAILGGSVVYALDHCRAMIAKQPEYCIRPADLRLIQTTTWMTPEIDREIRSTLSGLPSRMSLMDERSAKDVAQCLERSPWIRKVNRVVLESPYAGGKSKGLEVSLSFRRPVAFVRLGDGPGARYLLVDGEGTRLSREPTAEPLLGSRVFMVIGGVTSQPPAQGQVWQDPAVLAGAEVADVLREDVSRFNLAGIDVSNIGGQRDRKQAEIVVTTRKTGTRILWGGPRNRKTETLEGTPLEKTQFLEKLYKKLGGFEGRVTEIDLVERQLRRDHNSEAMQKPALRS